MTNKTRFTLRAAVYLLLIKDDQVLLIKRKNTGWQDGNYSLCAGHLDGNETVTEAMIREAKEEIGIEINSSDISVVHVMHRTSDSEYIDFYLKPTHWKGIPQNLEEDKCSEVRWFPLDNIPENIVPGLKQVLLSYQNNIFFSELS